MIEIAVGMTEGRTQHGGHIAVGPLVADSLADCTVEHTDIVDCCYCTDAVVGVVWPDHVVLLAGSGNFAADIADIGLAGCTTVATAH